jgi:arylsulfotransferase ASST
MSNRTVQSRSLTVVAAIVCAAAIAATAPAGAATVVSAYPSPGSKVASARTQITLRGVGPSGVGPLAVTGSRSGAHSGRLLAHSDGVGTSFLPDTPFAAGETVTVQTHLPVRRSRNGAYTFRIAVQGPPIRPPRKLPPPILKGNGIQRFHSRPDLIPPKLAVGPIRRGTAPGSIFVGAFAFPGLKGPGQAGPMILDERGRTIWFKPMSGTDLALDVRVQRYQGRPVLTWWQGFVNAGVGSGDGLIFDTSYRQIATARAGNGYRADPHEFVITKRDTALLVVDNPVEWDVSSIHGAKRAVVYDAVVQEVEIPTGLVRFEWHSLDHVAPRESYTPPPKTNGHIYDYFHINSAGENRDGSFLVSGRNTWAVYKVDRGTGTVVWRLNGKRSTFRMARGSTFAWQHDARSQADGTITMYDNGAAPPVHTQSHGIGIHVDVHSKKAWLVRNYLHKPKVLANSQGNVQLLPNGNVFVGWGNLPLASEFDRHGRLLLDLRFPPGDESYRSYRFPWSPAPIDAPAIAASANGRGTTTVYASWNGAANVAAWNVLAGPTPSALSVVASVRKTGFETKAVVRTSQPFVAVQAKDAAGKVLAASHAIQPHGP